MAQLQKTPISVSIYDGRNFQQIYDASHVISSNNLQQKNIFYQCKFFNETTADESTYE